MTLLQDHSSFVDRCLTVYGTGHFLLIGDSASKYAAIFRQRNACVSCLEEGRVTLDKLQGALAGSRTNPYTTIVMLHPLDEIGHEEIESIIRKLYEAGSPYICLVTDITRQIDGHIRDSAWWQIRFFSAGFRQHPRSFHVLDYANRESPPSFATLCFEKIPEKAVEIYPLEYLEKERILHMDMLRDPGRRSDAHLVRYVMAAPYIRPGDTVLDCACGLGYGTHILYQNSRALRILGIDFSESAIAYAAHNYSIPGIIEFSAGDAQNLSQLADNSIDFITSFETIEHLPEPARYLGELARVLRPSGRVMFSAPDKWVDETGKDPNPHHFHVYTWEKLYAEVTEHFLPDKGFIQIAGGALRLPDGNRHWEEVPCQPFMEKDAEWILLLAMKNPLSGKDVPYVETTFPESDDPGYHVGAFGKDYLNPWLLKGMVSRGYRLANEAALQELQDTVIAEFPPDSVDYGAALCGKCYSLLFADVSMENPEALCALIEDYVAFSPANPHVMRWQVSLLFAAALLRRKFGALEEAEALFMRCATVDVLPYSPLLGNRTLDALHSGAMLALGRDDVETTNERLRRAIKEAIRLVQGSWVNVILDEKTPFEPGFPEIAQLMDKAARCCYMLGELDTCTHRPGLAYSMGKGWYEMIIGDSTRHVGALQNQLSELQQYIADQKKEQNQLSEELQQCIADQKKENERLTNEVIGYIQSKSWKVTAPLRKIASIIRKIKNLLMLRKERGRRIMVNGVPILNSWPKDVRSLRMPWHDSTCMDTKHSCIGVFLHIFYTELTGELLQAVANIPAPLRIYVSTDTEEKKVHIAFTLDKGGFVGRHEIRVMPNRGWDIAPFLIGFADRIREHEIILRLHGKRSGHLSEEKSSEWRTLLFSSLAGNEERVRSILAAFARCPSLGLVCPEHWHVILPFINTEVDSVDMNRLLTPFGCHILPTDPIDFPSGSMFWCRSEALEPLLAQNLTWDDFDPTDGEKRWNTLAHAIERTFFFMCGFAGLQWSRVPQLGAIPPIATPGDEQKEPSVSVILTSYNYARYIGITITSVLSQTWKNWELIVMDDGSTDNSVELINAFACEDSRIILLRHPDEGNHGLAASLHYAMKHAKCELVAFIESDDYWHEAYLETHVAAMKQYDADITYCHPVCVAQPNDQQKLHDFEDYLRFCETHVPLQNKAKSLRDALSERNIIPTMSCVVAKRFLFTTCNWEPPIAAWLDWWLWMQIADAPFYRIPVNYTFWRIHASSYHGKQKKKRIVMNQYALMRAAHASLCAADNSEKTSC